MKINKEKIFLSAILILQVFFIGYYLITKNTSKDADNLNSFSASTVGDIKTVHNQPNPVSDDGANSNNKRSTIIPPKTETPENSTSNDETDTIYNEPQVKTNSNLSKISTNDYINNLNTIDYTISSGETISSLLRKYENTCNYKTGIKYLKSLNPNVNLDNLEINSKIKIPSEAFTLGHLYLVESGDNWYQLIKNNYPTYDIDILADFLIYINDLPSSDLPLGEKVFLPKL